MVVSISACSKRTFALGATLAIAGFASPALLAACGTDSVVIPGADASDGAAGPDGTSGVDGGDSSLGVDAGDSSRAVDGACPANPSDCTGKCGQLIGSCGTVVDCGSCAPGLSCGAGGTPNVCGMGMCTPSCAGKACGASDGCSGICTQGTCGQGQRCSNGACVCDPASCAGCCSSNQCLDGMSSGACGSGGATCQACDPTTSCQGGTCAAKQWVKQPIGTTSSLTAIWGSGKNDVYVIGVDGVFHSDGTGTWTAQSPSPQTTDFFYVGGLWGQDANTVLAMGGGSVYRLTAPGTWQAWTALGSCPNSSQAIWASGVNDVYSVAPNDVECHSQSGAAFVSQTLFRNLYAVWGSGPTDVYIGGDYNSGGVIYRAPGNDSWQALIYPNDVIYGLWGIGGINGTVYAVGGSGILLRSVMGGTFLELGSTVMTTIYGIWGSSLTDVYAVGASGVIVHSPDGVSFAQEPTPVSTDLRAVWGSGADDVYAVGAAGAVLHLQ